MFHSSLSVTGPVKPIINEQMHITFFLFIHRTNLKDVILEGRDAFSSAHGMQIFEYINSDRQFAEVFDRAMSEPSIMILKKVLEVYKGFEDVNTLVDVGGGSGTTLGLVTSKYPHIKGVNFDLPQVLTNAPSYPGTKTT